MAASRWRLEHLQADADNDSTRATKRPKAVLVYQGVSTIAPDDSLEHKQQEEQDKLAKAGLADDYVMTVLLEGGGSEDQRCVVHACHIASRNIYHQCSLTSHLDAAALTAATKGGTTPGGTPPLLAGGAAEGFGEGGAAAAATTRDLEPLRAAVKAVLARLQFRGGKVVVGGTPFLREDAIVDIGAGLEQPRLPSTPPKALVGTFSPAPAHRSREGGDSSGGGGRGVVQRLRKETSDRREDHHDDDGRGGEGGDGGEEEEEWEDVEDDGDDDEAEAAAEAADVSPEAEAARLLRDFRRPDMVTQRVQRSQEVKVRFVTWNMQAKSPPAATALRQKLLPMNAFHVYVVGTEECENTIAQSVINASKDKWIALLREVFGSEYDMLCSHALQATHNIVFVHNGLKPLVSNIKTHVVSTGMKVPGHRLGNKGGIGVSFSVGGTSMVFVNAHLAHGKDGLQKRNVEYSTITAGMARVLIPAEHQSMGGLASKEVVARERRRALQAANDGGSSLSSDGIDGEESRPRPPTHAPPTVKVDMSDDAVAAARLLEWFDVVVWGGDLNYRVAADRGTVDSLLRVGDIRPILEMDQLRTTRRDGRAFQGLEEGEITFPPTYKYDKVGGASIDSSGGGGGSSGDDVFDTSAKQRVPSWTDRVLYKASPAVRLLTYGSVQSLRTSDHRPVQASFVVQVDVDPSDGAPGTCPDGVGSAQSQVCSIM